MKKSLAVSMVFLTVILLGSSVVIDPWPLRGGVISASLGFPTLAIRYGLLDFVEVGASMREEGGYIKLGYGADNFALSLGFATFVDYSNLFAALGLKFFGFEADLVGRYYQFGSLYGTEDWYSVGVEASLDFAKSGNMTSGLGVFGNYSFSKEQTDTLLGIFAKGKFENVWILDGIRLMGGLGVRIDESFNLMEDAYVIFDISVFLNVFRR